jgi:tetratricopeptide (TPR) repeat protein
MRAFILILLIGLLSGDLYSQSVNKMLREGNRKFEKGNFDEAEVKYRKALEISPDYRATFNLGDALYKREQYADAINKFSDIVAKNPDPKTTSHAYHNIGNAHFKAGEYEKSLAAYRNSLRLNPNDEETRYNYEMARRMIQVQQQQQQQNQQQQNQQDEQQQNQQQQNQQNQNQQQQQNQQNQEQNEQNQQNQQQQNQQNEQNQQQQNQQQRRQEISKEDAERILNALMKEEQNVQKKVNKRRGERRSIDKNW